MPTISIPTDGGTNGDGYDFAAAQVTLVVTSTGTVTSDVTEGIYAGFSTDSVANSGMIAGADGGIFANASGFQLRNYQNGTINGQTVGVGVAGDNESVANDGIISAPMDPGAHVGLLARNGVAAAYSMVASNAGTIEGYVAVDAANGSSAVITNRGEIDGGVASISSRGGLTNLSFFTDGALLAIHNDGTLRGDVLFGAGGGSFDGNGGTVDGNISGGAGGETFDLSHQVVTGTITGGGGYDVISVGSASGGFAIDLGQGTASGAGEAFDFSGIENAVGSRYADTIVGDAADNVISGGSGNDVVAGGGGADTIDGGAGNDTLDGGTGTNTLSYNSATAGVTVSLAAQGSAQATGGGGTDTVSAFQNLTGSAYNDTLTGDANANFIHGGAGNDAINGGNGNNVLYGDAGNDTIVGGSGVDAIVGGAGQDTLTGGAGTDRFAYKLVSDSTSAAPDLITDFVSGSDKLDISALHTSGSDTFTITSSGGYTYVAVDQGGNGTTDTLIKLTGTNILGASDVIWGTAPAIHPTIVSDPSPHLTQTGHHDLTTSHHAVMMDHALYG